jgi:hypothetical protein
MKTQTQTTRNKKTNLVINKVNLLTQVKKETTKKETAPKKEKVPATKKIDKAIAEVKKSKVELIEFSITAIIPTQMYGNIQPTIKVKANTLEDARDTVVPFVEDLYKKYAEVLPKFLREVVVVERVVPEEVIKETPKNEIQGTPASVQVQEAKAVPVPNTYQGQKNDNVAGQPKDSTEIPFGPEVKNEAYVNA